MSILRDPDAKSPEGRFPEPQRTEKSNNPVVYIADDGKAKVWNDPLQNKRIRSLLRKLRTTAKPRAIAISTAIGLLLLIFLLAGSKSDAFKGKVLGKDSACSQKIATLSNWAAPGGPLQTSLYINSQGTVSLAIPGWVRSEQAADEEEKNVLFVSDDGTLSILLETTERQTMPIQLRTLHRLTLESMTSELNAQATSPSSFLLTRGGNEAFETCMQDESYDYGIITAASSHRFVTVLFAALRSDGQEEAVFKEQLASLIRAAGSSLYIE